MLVTWNGGCGLADWLVLVMAIGFVMWILAMEARDAGSL